MVKERVDFHCHTIYSKDSMTEINTLIKTLQQKAIDRVVITDHNTIAGARAAQAIDPQRIIIGEEIKTNSGEILAIFLQEFVPPGLSPQATIQRLRDQDAFISVSHPFDRIRSGAWQESELVKIIDQIDAIEIFNSRCLSPDFNHQAQLFAQRHSLAGTVGSDAHAAFEIGQATLTLDHFNNAEELRSSLHNAQVHARLSGLWVHFVSRYYAWRKIRKEKLK